jgi:hypothetical protein
VNKEWFDVREKGWYDKECITGENSGVSPEFGGMGVEVLEEVPEVSEGVLEVQEFPLHHPPFKGATFRSVDLWEVVGMAGV